MKFKHLIIAFCVLIIFIAAITILVPLMVSGSQAPVTFNLHYFTIPLLSFMALFLICISIYFIINYRLLSLLEKEDWPALAYYLENQIYEKSRYTFRNVRLLASSYIVISDFKSVLKLESKAQLVKPSVVGKNTLIFGSARILDGNHKEAAVFFKSNQDKCGKKDAEWVRWFSGFSQLLAGSFAAAEEEFSSMAVSSKDALITGLSAYFLSFNLEKKSAAAEKCRHIHETGKDRVIKALKNAAGWKKESDKAGNEIYIAIIKKYIIETGSWIFSKS